MEIHVLEEEYEGSQDFCRILTFQINHIHISIHIVPKNLLAAVIQFSMQLYISMKAKEYIFLMRSLLTHINFN